MLSNKLSPRAFRRASVLAGATLAAGASFAFGSASLTRAANDAVVPAAVVKPVAAPAHCPMTSVKPAAKAAVVKGKSASCCMSGGACCKPGAACCKPGSACCVAACCAPVSACCTK